MPNEIELKLRIDAADAPFLFNHPALKHGLEHGPLTRQLISTYFDTPELGLLNAEISLRVRSMSGGWFQAVKAAGSSVAGLHQRMEWEDIINGSSPDFSKITEPALAAIFADSALRDALQPIFLTDVERTEWQLRMPDGTALEVALDLGELEVGSDIRETISEVEIELKSGDAAQVFSLALALQADIPLTIENISKAQRGYGHYRTLPPELSVLTPATLPDMLDKEGLTKLAWACLHHLQSKQALLEADATELQQHAIAEIRSTLQYLVNALQAYTSTPAALLTEYHWLQDAIAAMQPDEEALPQQVNTRLQSQHCQRLLLQTGAWLLA
ncbi:CYTH domain-containing protein [Methylovorus menthalis]|uniref:CYTH domain-containing protein n=1 Tax=Methylovorus menthalis TaxID=1002227 RepID=UPI001E412A2C|nr:CYTH domain-containing protein [Methylovorus menthalis]MCB4810561.1 CYTH domain-containing protein [Methylovorus menthalis]